MSFQAGNVQQVAEGGPRLHPPGWMWLAAFAVLTLSSLGMTHSGADRAAKNGESTGASLSYDAKASVFMVHGLGKSALKAFCALKTPEKTKIFSIYPQWEDQTQALNVYPMLGEYQCHSGIIIFKPAFPLNPGLTYLVRLRIPAAMQGGPVDLSLRQSIPVRQRGIATEVVGVYPSNQHVPANLLKFYILFSQPMSLDGIRENIRILDDKGHPIEMPFLDIHEELWDRDRRRLTLFLDPGRIKRGLVPHLTKGAPLTSGQSMTLVIDKAWRDGQGAPLHTTYRKSYQIVAPDRQAPQPDRWRWTLPRQLSHEPLVLSFPEAMDYGLLLSGLAVVDESGRAIQGEVRVEQNESQWRFTPATQWVKNKYVLQVTSRLEDLAGNNLTRVFDRDLVGNSGTQSELPKTLHLPFKTKAPAD